MRTGAERFYSRLMPRCGASWEEAAPAPAVREEQPEADVLVLGGGAAGLAAAARCAQAGLAVTLIEAGETLPAAEPLIGAADGAPLREAGVHIDKAALVRDWESLCGGRCGEEFIWLYLKRSGEAVDWLLNLEPGAALPRLYRGYYRGAELSAAPGDILLEKAPGSPLAAEDSGGLLAELLSRAFLRAGGMLRLGERAVSLRREGEAVVGLVTVDGAGFARGYTARRGVILACGNIENDAEWLERFCSTALRAPFTEGPRRGDGQRLAYEAGASFEQPQWAVGFENTAYAPFSLPFLAVNRLGRRFMNEDAWGQARAIRCLMQPGGDWAWTILDANWREDAAKLLSLCGLPEALPCGGTEAELLSLLETIVEEALANGNAFCADSLAELAEKTAIPAPALEKTVERYNALCARGKDTDLGKRAALLTEVKKPPFTAVKWGPRLRGVYGGIRVDEKLRVRSAEGAPIPGLYAAGSAAAGIFELDLPFLLTGAPNGWALSGALVLAKAITEKEAQHGA